MKAVEGDKIPESGFIDLNRSRFQFLERFVNRAEQSLPIRSDEDVAATISAAERHDSYHDDIQQRYKLVASGAYYWTHFLRGYQEYLDHGAVVANNSHLIFVMDALRVTNYDPNLKAKLSDPKHAADRIARRLRCLGEFISKNGSDTPAITLYYRDGPEDQNHSTTTEGKTFSWAYLDGYHRVFSAVVTGQVQILFRTVAQPSNGA